MREAQKMEAVGRLAGGMAHDFNHLLTAILGYSELILSRLEPGSTNASDLREVISAGKRGARLTRQLLSFSRRRSIPSERFMTGYSGKPLEAHDLDSDDEYLIQKPFTLVELDRAVRRALRSASERHDGRVWADAEPERGATVYVALAHRDAD